MKIFLRLVGYHNAIDAGLLIFEFVKLWLIDLFVLLRVPSLKFENPDLAIAIIVGIFESKKLLQILVGRLGSDRQCTHQ